MIGALDKLLLVVPSNTYRAQRFLEAARRLGVLVAIATDSEMSAPDHLGMVFDRLDFCDAPSAAEELASLARSYGITHALAVDEGGVEIAALTNASLTGSGQGLEGILATRDKAGLRTALSAAEIPQPRWVRLPAACSSDHAALRDIGFPLVVKPTKGSGSIGVTLARNQNELARSVEIARAVGEEMKTRGNEILAELYDSLRDRQIRMGKLALYLRPARAEHIIAEHQELAQLFREESLEKLLTKMAEHIQGTRDALVS
jgi:biotin carboxylase